MPAWEQLSINKPHLAYLILGGFTSLFMLCSLFVKEKLYIGEATVATICGIIFGPHAANLFDPSSWGNVDQITLECSRVVLVVQCFAVGVELPKAYMERHWKSVLFLLVPVMTFGWLMTSLFIWWMITPLTWLESLACAACVTATDPVLASSVVGKGKFAKRVPKHLRDILSAESGCNDGMAFPFIYLSFYLIKYKPDASAVAYHWFCHTILYECIFGAVYGVLIGYIGRHAIKWADSKALIDRESFLVFYFTLALFCAGTGSLLGTDDLLVGFAAGIGFSNDGWFTHKTEESHVSNVIDLLLNLAYFVYFGSIIPWGQYNAPEIGITPWRLVVIAIFVLLFRRIPIMMALKPIIPDIKTWREALFAGHFGPIGVGAIFAAILARAELETDTTEPLGELPTDLESENYTIIQVIWPLTTFLVMTSIIVHGSSIAVFTLGKRINTLTLTMSYTQANEDGPSWMNRLPRIASTSKSQSKAKSDFSTDSSSEEKLPEYPPGTLPPIGLPGNFLRRQKEEDTPIETKRNSGRRKSKWDSGMGPGGPISQSAITPIREHFKMKPEDNVSDTLNEKNAPPSPDSQDEGEPPDQLEMEMKDEKRTKKHAKDPKHIEEPTVEAYQEGNDLVVEDEEGNILSISNTQGETEDQKKQHIYVAERDLERETSGEHAKGKYHPHEKTEGEEIEKDVAEGLGHPEQATRKWLGKLVSWGHKDKSKDEGPSEPKHAEHRRGPAHAYQFGNTIIVEDEDGEVVKKYEIPHNRAKGGRGGYQDGPSNIGQPMRQGLKRMGTWAHLNKETADPAPSTTAVEEEKEQPPRWYRKFSHAPVPDDPDEDKIRFTVDTGSGRRMSKQDFIDSMRQLDPKARIEAVEDSDAPTKLKQGLQSEAAEEHKESRPEPRRESTNASTRFPFPNVSQLSPHKEEPEGPQEAALQRKTSREDHPLTLVDSNDDTIPVHSVPSSISKYAAGKPESAAAARRRRAAQAIQEEDSDDDGTERVPPHHAHTFRSPSDRRASAAAEDAAGETAAEKRRRLAALGERKEESDSEDDNTVRKPKGGHEPVKEPERKEKGISFADTSAGGPAQGSGSGASTGTFGRVQWGEGVGKRRGR